MNCYAMGPLDYARKRYDEASKILKTARMLKGSAPPSLQAHADIMIRKAEFHVLMHLEALWQAQCREIFNDDGKGFFGDGFFASEKCRKAVNAVDWKQTRGNMVVFKDEVEGFF